MLGCGAVFLFVLSSFFLRLFSVCLLGLFACLLGQFYVDRAAMMQNSLRENLSRIQERIARAAERAGRRADEIALIAVTKTHSAETVREAFEAGLRHFGENRVQEWERKRAALEDLAATWHLIGHLQSNKAGRAAKYFDSVDSVDDFALGERLDRARGEMGESDASAAKLRILLEVRVEEERSKSGVEIAAVPTLAEKVATLPWLELAGLMCIPPFLEDTEAVRPYFRRLRELRDEMTRRLGRELPVLSMGMSHDFEAAIAEGATEVRIGTALFGARERMPGWG